MKEFKGLKLYELYEGRMTGERELVKAGFRLDTKYLEALKPIADGLGCAVSEILRAVVSEWVSNNPDNGTMTDGEYKGLKIFSPGQRRKMTREKLSNKELFLDPNDYKKLRWDAVCSGCSVSEIIRAIVSDWMDKNFTEKTNG